MLRLLKLLGFTGLPLSLWTPVPSLGLRVHARFWRRHRDVPGRSTPIVLVAGLGVSSRYWVPVARRLGETRDVLAPDLPGFGRTGRMPGSRWPGGPDVTEQADQLVAWMDARGIERAILCGHSVGCGTVADVAARFPHRVERVILAAPVYEQGKRHIARQFGRLARGGLFELPALLVVLAVEYSTAGLPRAIQQAIRTMKDPIEANLPNVTAPALVIHGQHDTMITRDWARRVAAMMPDGRYVEIDRAGHAMQFSAPEVMAQVVEQFLGGQMDRPAARESSVVAPMIGRRRLPFLSPPQPIPSWGHAALDYVTAIAAATVPEVIRCGPATRRTLTAAGAVSAANTLVTDIPGSATPRLPMTTHLTLDMASGLSLLALAAVGLRREPTPGRWAVASLGLLQLAASLLTHAPMGPARSSPVGREAVGPGDLHH